MSHPTYPQSEIASYTVDTSGGPRYHGRQHTHEETSTSITLDVSSSQSRSSMDSFSHSLEPEQLKDDIFKADPKDKDKDAEKQSEDCERRPSVTVYQLEDSDHPDIKSIQQMVEGMKFGDSEDMDS